MRRTQPRLWSFADLCHRAELAIVQARNETNVGNATHSLAACRIWSMRAEYALIHGAIAEDSFESVDEKMNKVLGIAMVAVGATKGEL